MPNGRLNRWEFPEAQHQFGGFGGTVGGGITIPIFGSGGFSFGGIRGGLIPGGGFQGRGGSGIGPVLTLESAFGTGFTAQSIADAIRVAEQSGRFTTQGPATGSIEISTGPELSIVLNLARGLFEIFDRSTGKKVGGGVTPEAAIEAVRAGPFRPTGIPFVAPEQAAAPIPGPAAGGEFGELLRTILGALGQLRGRSTIPGLEPVAIGGTVNVPVVRGSTADPTGTLAPIVPRAPPPPPPPTARAAATNLALQALQLFLRLRAERALREAQRRARALQAQRLAAFQAAVAAQRRATVPFGQSGSDFLDFAGRLGEIALPFFARPPEPLFSVPQFPAPIQAQPVGLPAVLGPFAGGLAGGLGLGELFGGGGGGSCPQLFRPGTMRSRPASVVCIPDPTTGEARFFGHLGTPLLFSRDVSAAKKVRKLANRFARKG